MPVELHSQLRLYHMAQVSERQFKSTTERFYTNVRDEYAKMIAVKSKGGKQVFDQDYIFETLGEKFFRSPKTIENIVFNRVVPNTRIVAREPVAMSA